MTFQGVPQNSVIEIENILGTWVAQSIKRPTLDLGSGHDLMVCGFEPHIRLCALTTQTEHSPSLPVSALAPTLSSLCLSQINFKEIK